MDFFSFPSRRETASLSARKLRGVFAAMLAFPTAAFAQWSGIPGVNNAIVADPAIYPQAIVAVSDGAGGAAFLWHDGRVSNSDYNLYAQRLDANGAAVWGANGTAVCDLPGDVAEHFMIPDGAGGFYVAWVDRRTINGSNPYHAYVQRLNAAGQAQWAAQGQLLRENAYLGYSEGKSLSPDGAGGVYVFSGPASSGATDNARRLHRLTSTGQVAPGWPAEGVDLNLPLAIWSRAIIPDQPADQTGEHGVLLVFHGVGGGNYVQQVNADGTLGFSTSVYSYFGTYSVLGVCTDGAGGAFVVTGGNADMFVFRVKADGTMEWPENDRRVVTSGGWANSQPVAVISDGAGGAIVSWFGPITSGQVHTVAQRISPTGQRLWGDTGIEVVPPNNNTYVGDAISDGAGGVIVTWGVASPGQVRAQRLDANGTKLWPADGVLIAEPWGQTQLVTDQASGAVYSVLTNSGGSGYSFGAKRTTLTGSLGSNSPLARLINISSRAQVGTGDDVLIPGFVVSGGSVQLLVRGIGPTLANFNVSGVLADPQLTLYNSSNQVVDTNDDWGLASNASEIETVRAQVSAFALPGGSKDSAVLVTLQPGLYTAVMRGAGSTTGVGLVEMYEVGGATNPGRLANMSVRARVGTGDSILIPGIVVGGSDARTLLIRAVGPTLATFNVSGVLSDPQIALFNNGGTQLAVNDNWNTPNGAQIANFGSQVGAFGLPANSKDAAFLITLSPGLYTAQVSGVGGSTGVCLVEVYEVP